MYVLKLSLLTTIAAARGYRTRDLPDRGRSALQSSLESAHRHARRRRRYEFETSAQKLEVRAGAVLAQQVRETAAEMRRELHADVYAVSLKSRELLHPIHEAHRRPVLVRWLAIGLLFGFILLLCGVWIGRITALG